MTTTEKIIIGSLAAGILTVGVLIIRTRKAKGVNAKGWVKPAVGKLTSPVGYRTDPTTGAQQFHNGQDIAVPIGTQVRAPKAGIIMSATPTEAGGNQIVMNHDEPGAYNGWFSGFAHLSKVYVEKDQHVSQGQVIALSGNTGAHTTGPHLHFTLKDAKGNTMDPRNIVYT